MGADIGDVLRSLWRRAICEWGELMVTKQEQLEWLANKIVKWPAYVEKIPVSVDDAGNPKFYMPWDTVRVDCTREEWQQERDKMQKRDNSWHERGELPPVGCECLSPSGETIMITSHGSISDVPVAFYPFGVGGLYSAACAKQFRPLRTEREKAIDEMVEAAKSSDKYSNYKISDDVIRVISERIYDAGHHK